MPLASLQARAIRAVDEDIAVVSGGLAGNRPSLVELFDELGGYLNHRRGARVSEHTAATFAFRAHALNARRRCDPVELP